MERLASADIVNAGGWSSGYIGAVRPYVDLNLKPHITYLHKGDARMGWTAVLAIAGL